MTRVGRNEATNRSSALHKMATEPTSQDGGQHRLQDEITLYQNSASESNTKKINVGEFGNTFV
jgi:hypothetical protein